MKWQVRSSRWTPTFAQKGAPLVALILGVALLAQIGISGKYAERRSVAQPQIIVTRVEVEYVFTRSARFLVEFNAYNPNDFPVDMDVNLELQSLDYPSDVTFMSFGNLTTSDIAPMPSDVAFLKTNEGRIRLYPHRYHPFIFRGLMQTEIPTELRREGKDYIWPYLYDYGASLGLQGPVGIITMNVVGQGTFVGDGNTFVISISERMSVPYPFSN